MKNTRCAFVLASAAAIGLTFAGCASAPPSAAAAPVTDAASPIAAPVTVPADTVALVTAPPMEEDPAADVSTQSPEQVLAEEERGEALKAMARADEVQGKNTEKDAYRKAAAVFDNGDRNRGKEDWDAAYFDFHSAREAFDILAARAKDRRQAALDALARSKARAGESESFALALDKILAED